VIGRESLDYFLELLEHNGTCLKALHLYVSLKVMDLTTEILIVHLGPSSSQRVFTPSLGGMP
jgi:hypothetical protein